MFKSVRSERKESITVQSTLADTSSVQPTQKNHETLRSSFLVGDGSMQTNMHEGCKATRFGFRSSLHNRQSRALDFGRLESNHHFLSRSFCRKLGMGIPYRYSVFGTTPSTSASRGYMTRRLRLWHHDFAFMSLLLYSFLFLLWAKLCIFTNIGIREEKGKTCSTRL